MKRILLETTEIVDRVSFCEAFKELLGSPEWYGANMNAWIDCVSDPEDTESSITRFKLSPGETLITAVVGSESFAEQMPDVFAGFVPCTAFVNQQYLTRRGEPVVTLAFCCRRTEIPARGQG